MKRTEIQILSLIVSAIFSAVIVPAGLSAQEGGVEGLHTNKNSTYDNSTHQGKITLETFVEGEVNVITKTSSPCDIVLVLDMSESMNQTFGSGTKIDALKSACSTFLQNIVENARVNGVEHRVAIVSYNEYFPSGQMTYGSRYYDGTVVWPQNTSGTGTTYSGKNAYGQKDEDNNTKLPKNTNPKMPQLYDYVVTNGIGNNCDHYFIPVTATDNNIGSAMTIPEHIVDCFSDSDAYGETACFRGMEEAQSLLNNRSQKQYMDGDGVLKYRPTFVILFTDGIPGQTDPKDNEAIFSDDNASIGYAYNTIAVANQLKRDGTVVYTIGIHPVCNPVPSSGLFYIHRQYHYLGMSGGYYYYNTSTKSDPQSNDAGPCENALNVFLHMVSSNYAGIDVIEQKIQDYDYPDGKGMDRWAVLGSAKTSELTDTQKSEIINGGHYLSANNSDGLMTIFEGISQDIIEEVVAKELGVETVLKDFINKVYFKLPDNATKADISVYTRPFERMDENNQYVFGTVTTKIPVKDVDPDGVVDIIFSQENGNDCVSVTGYSYKDNWVGFDISRNPHGCELVVEIPFVFKDGVELDGNLDTNTGDSGIYTPDNPEEPVEPYPVPTLSFKDLTITRSDLESGESAIYNVYSVNQDSKLVYTVVLTGTTSDGSETASKTISGVLARDSEGNFYEYKVTESDWDWAYNKDADNNSKTSTFAEGSNRLEFEFEGAHKDKNNTTDPAYKQSHTEVKKSDRISKTN